MRKYEYVKSIGCVLVVLTLVLSVSAVGLESNTGVTKELKNNEKKLVTNIVKSELVDKKDGAGKLIINLDEAIKTGEQNTDIGTIKIKQQTFGTEQMVSRSFDELISENTVISKEKRHADPDPGGSRTAFLNNYEAYKPDSNPSSEDGDLKPIKVNDVEEEAFFEKSRESRLNTIEPHWEDHFNNELIGNQRSGDRDTTTPPWDDNWHGSKKEGACYPPFCWQDAGSESDAYDGSAWVSSSCGVGGTSYCEAWFGFQGTWTCPFEGVWDVLFQITYSGTAIAANIPVGMGAGYMEIGAKAVYQLATYEAKSQTLWYQDSWGFVGQWDYGGTIGLVYNDITITPGTYEFAVEFQVWIDLWAAGFVVVGGGINIYGSFDEAEFFFPDSLPDLYVPQSLIWTDPAPGYFWPGDTVDLLGTVMNIGAADAGPFTVAVEFDDELIATGDFNGLLALSYMNLIVEGHEWPDDTDWHKVTWIADYYGEVSEWSESNNEASVWFRAREKADLTVTRVWATTTDYTEVDEEIEPGDDIIFWANISNLGDSCGSFVVKLFKDGELFAEGSVPGFGGHSYGWAYTDPPWSWPDWKEYTFTWIVDWYDQVNESNEDNNEKSRKIGPPGGGKAELWIGNIWSEPQTFRPGQMVYIYAEIINDGDADAGPFNIGIRVNGGSWQRVRAEDGLPAGYYIELKVWFTDGWPDDNCHTFTFYADIDKEVPEEDDNNNQKSASFCPKNRSRNTESSPKNSMLPKSLERLLDLINAFAQKSIFSKILSTFFPNFLTIH
ncbi:MAG: hypothetical protein KAW45_04330 [Thermoplasmatales archaeon]|nr:hypothetical protein [Thermoplasmatales archaeon]